MALRVSPFRRVLVANRGEIAVRILRTLRSLGIEGIAVYSDADRTALHTRVADRSLHLGAAPASESYLHIERIIDAARRSGAEAIHPGYGFLAESPEFAEACQRAGIAFIGPPIPAMRQMAGKIEARERMANAGLPLIPGGEAGSLDEARASAGRLGYPVFLKPSAGGGGKGMRRVDSEAELAGAYRRARSEAKNAFGDDTVYLEKLLVRPRHVEVQVLGDQHGHVVHLYERDCSLQRRHQKIIEESPCPRLDDSKARELGRIAAEAAADIGYFSAGTIEMLLDEEGNAYFLEMNTRLQVEHPVTELCTGLDLVEQMVRVAAGETLAFDATPPRRGHAIECRLYAEDPSRNFLPSPGKITTFDMPSGPGVRVDEGAHSGDVVSAEYDPLIAKIVTHGVDRTSAIARMLTALRETRVTGIQTNRDFLIALLESDAFAASDHHTSYLDEIGTEAFASDAPGHDIHAIAAAIAAWHCGSSSPVRPDSRAAPSLSPWVTQHRFAQGRQF